MNGAESLVHTLLASGVDTCFSNPGTSEMHFVAALDRIPGMRCVLGLFEGVVTGAADGYYRVTDTPAATLLHCGPGLANGLANLHNARRGQSGIVNIVGDQATYHRPLDAPLTADTEGFARGVSAWVRTAHRAERVGADAAAAVQAARTSPGQVATLILPADTAWTEGGVVAPALPPPEPAPADEGAVAAAAGALRRDGAGTLILLGGRALRSGALEVAHRIASATGARLLAEQSNGRIERGRGRVPIERMPYPVDAALKATAGIHTLITVGAKVPVAFFAYPGKPGVLIPEDCAVQVLARPDQDVPDALARLADRLGAPQVALRAGERPVAARGALEPEAFMRTLAARLPDHAVLVDEGVTFGRGFFPESHEAPPHDWLQLTGGAIGDGLPMATGAAVGAPGRRVVGLQADGSGMYTLQALWTQARERLDVTTIVFANRKYAILLMELAHVGANPGRTALDMLDLGRPDLDWVKLANGMGVEAAQATDCETLADLLAASFARPGPFLIELLI